MKSKGFIILTAIFLSVIFITQFKLINRPVSDNDEGIYLTSFLLVNNGNPPYKKTYFSHRGLHKKTGKGNCPQGRVSQPRQKIDSRNMLHRKD